jgi:hypothetical protein
MTDRKHTIVCVFDPSSPRITAHNIPEWLYETLKLPDKDVRMIQIDGPRRRVYIKFHAEEWVVSILQATDRGVKFRHENGELSTVHIELAGMGYRRIRLAKLLPDTIKAPRSVTHGIIRYTYSSFI